jgi:kumamolisin
VLENGDELRRRTVTLAGTASAMEKAFSVDLNEYQHDEGSYRGHTGPIQMPEEYASFVSGVFGLDNRPVANPQFRYRGASRAFGVRASNLSYPPAQVAKLYAFPADANGAGQTIGLTELGGGYRPADIAQYFQAMGLPAPTVKTISVDHGNNRPTTAQSADGEVMLDIEVAGAVAPGVNIAVYFAPNTARGFQDALSTAIHDQLNKPSAISISWGGPESTWTTQSMDNFNQMAQEAGLLGITVTVAAGDSGSSDSVNDGKNHVDFPASCPCVLACGGTQAVSAKGVITSETVWNDGAQGGATGGGYSTVFARPS